MQPPSKIYARLFGLKNVTDAFDNKVSKKATRGIDKIGIKHFMMNKSENLSIVYKKCRNGIYRFSPYLEKLQSKGRGKNPRVLSIPTIRDRVVLHLLKELLHEVFPESVVRKLPNNYIKEIKEFHRTTTETNLSYYKADIKSFYDNIDHAILMAIIRKRIKSKIVLGLIKKSLKNPTVPKNYKRKEKAKYINTMGVPQGIAISNILANIYLYGFDIVVTNLGLMYLRYVDDILVFHNGNKGDIEEALLRELDNYGLAFNSLKTEADNIKKSFDYLGYNISLPKISIKSHNIEKFITSIAAKFSSFSHNSEARLLKYTWLDMKLQKTVFIFDLNEKITGAISEDKRYGWLFYFLEINDMELLHKLDSIIEGFFKKLKEFSFTAPVELKSLSKAYYKARFDPFGRYIHNYDTYITIQSKIKYLSDRGYLNPVQQYRQNVIEMIFDRARRRRLIDLDLDVGKIY